MLLFWVWFGSAWKSRKALRHRSGPELLQDFLGLGELFDQPIDLGDRRATASGDALAAACVQKMDVPPLLTRHRSDDGLDAFELRLRAGEIGAFHELLDARDHSQELGHRSH